MDGAKNPDLYQLTAYGRAVGAARAVLIHAEAGEQGTLRVRRGGPEIEVLELGLDCELGELEKKLSALGEALGRGLSRQSSQASATT